MINTFFISSSLLFILYPIIMRKRVAAFSVAATLNIPVVKRAYALLPSPRSIYLSPAFSARAGIDAMNVRGLALPVKDLFFSSSESSTSSFFCMQPVSIRAALIHSAKIFFSFISLSLSVAFFVCVFRYLYYIRLHFYSIMNKGSRFLIPTERD